MKNEGLYHEIDRYFHRGIRQNIPRYAIQTEAGSHKEDYRRK